MSSIAIEIINTNSVRCFQYINVVSILFDLSDLFGERDNIICPRAEITNMILIKKIKILGVFLRHWQAALRIAFIGFMSIRFAHLLASTGDESQAQSLNASEVFML